MPSLAFRWARGAGAWRCWHAELYAVGPDNGPVQACYSNAALIILGPLSLMVRLP